ncbi:hypothetical protein [Spirosoma telluris]|uniref:hypothetical protein n=1 Tax=Spirosoma telluris TaxID=2183553 RepID=UPI002FC2787D
MNNVKWIMTGASIIHYQLVILLPMPTSPFFLNDLTDFLQKELTTDRYPDAEQGGIYYPPNDLSDDLG